MARKRKKENKSLPARWEFYHGSFYYRVPAGLEHKWDGKKRFRLGKTLPEAHRTFAARMARPVDELITIGQALDRYALEVVPTKAPKNQKQNLRAIERLRQVFGHMPLAGFRPHHAYRYRDERGRVAATAANRELEVLSHLFTKCFEWGVPLTTHPMMEGKFRKLPRKARERIIEDWEIEEIAKLEPPKFGRSAIPMLKAYVALKVVSGRRRVEILRLKTTDLLPNGVRWTLAKQRQSGTKHLITKWTPELRAAIDAALAARPIGKRRSKKHYKPTADISPWIFCKADGTPYLTEDGDQSDGFQSVWTRFMNALIKNTKITERFHDSDLRAKAAQRTGDVAKAQKLLAHTTPQTTRKHYYRAPEEVDPAG